MLSFYHPLFSLFVLPSRAQAQPLSQGNQTQRAQRATPPLTVSFQVSRVDDPVGFVDLEREGH